MDRVLRFLIVLTGLTLGIAVSGFSYSLNACNGMTGGGVLGLSPSLAFPVSPEFGVTADLIGAYGFTPNFDVMVDAAGLNIAPQFSYNYSWVMPRFEFLPGQIAAVQIQLNNADPMSFNVNPQYHLFLENDSLAFEFNAIFSLPFSDLSATTIGAIIVPVWKAVKDILYPFIEIDPSYTFGVDGGFHLNIVPGFWLGIPETPLQFCIAFTMGDVLSGSMTYGVNFWYSVSFNLIPDSENK